MGLLKCVFGALIANNLGCKIAIISSTVFHFMDSIIASTTKGPWIFLTRKTLVGLGMGCPLWHPYYTLYTIRPNECDVFWLGITGWWWSSIKVFQTSLKAVINVWLLLILYTICFHTYTNITYVYVFFSKKKTCISFIKKHRYMFMFPFSTYYWS